MQGSTIIRYLMFSQSKYYDVNYKVTNSAYSSDELSEMDPVWTYEIEKEELDLSEQMYYLELSNDGELSLKMDKPESKNPGHKYYQLRKLTVQTITDPKNKSFRFAVHPSKKLLDVLNEFLENSPLKQADSLRHLLIVGTEKPIDEVPDEYRVFQRYDEKGKATKTFSIRVDQDTFDMVDEFRKPEEGNLGLAIRLVYSALIQLGYIE